MNFTMKILAVSVLLVAMVALATEAEAVRVTEALVQKDEAADDSSKKHEVAKRSVCDGGDWRRYGKKEYRYFPSQRTWAEAEAFCRALGGNLASVHDKAENDWLSALSQKKETWMGFSDAQQEKHWFWIDGTALNYLNWCSGQPNNAHDGEHCAGLWGGCWHDYHCVDRQFPYICGRAPQ